MLDANDLMEKQETVNSLCSCISITLLILKDFLFFVFPFPSKRVAVTPPEKKPGEVKLTDEQVNALFHITLPFSQ